VPIEKVFAINAPPSAIFAAIERDLADASEYEGTTHEVLVRDPDRAIELRVTIGAIPCKLRYTLEEKAEYTEVTGTIVPYGWRYAAFRIITFGLRDTNFAVALVQALANLKAEVERPA
jgi:hypothetical protein